MRSLDDILRKALEAPADCSPSFTTRVSALAAALVAQCSVAAVHDSSMDYSAAQSIYWIESEMSGSLKIVVSVSSRADIYTRLLYREARPREWFPAHALRLTGEVERRWDCARGQLDARGFTFVPFDLLSRPAVGRATEMDGAPAALLEVLFTEVA